MTRLLYKSFGFKRNMKRMFVTTWSSSHHFIRKECPSCIVASDSHNRLLIVHFEESIKIRLSNCDSLESYPHFKIRVSVGGR